MRNAHQDKEQEQEEHAARPGQALVLVLAAALLPALTAIWTHPGFVTQDGPAHLYNAEILARSLFESDSPFRSTYAVRWEPLPNWAGHVALVALVTTLPSRVADRAMTSLTLVALAAGLTWLRGKVAGRRGIVAGTLTATVIALNVTWLFGFNSFVLGAALFPVTLGVWWGGRDLGFSARRAGTLAGLMVVGYFCHLVSLGLTAFGLVVLETLTPGERRAGRAASTAFGLLPLGPLGLLYLGLMRRGGGKFAPAWAHLADLMSPRVWFTQLTWVDPISLAKKDVLPLTNGFSAPWCAALAPVVWLAVGLMLAAIGGWRRREREKRAWWVLAGLLMIGGVAGPDTLGATHGHYLPQRIVLLALAAILPVVRFGRVATVAVAVALVVQSATVWDYARTSERSAGRIWKARDALGAGQRIAALWIDIRTPPSRANPLLHADCLLGIGNANVIWGNYETRFYYFPVRFLDGLNGPDPAELEAIALDDAPENAPTRALRWERLLARHHDAIDILVVWGRDPALDAINARWYAVESTDGPLRILRRRSAQ